jgi:hypothetical protein
MLRAALLLTVLPALALAAPAPFPRERRDPDAHTWSKPVDGLRVRLVVHSMRYRLGETVRLMLVVQNVSGSVLLEDPHLRPTVHPVAPRGWGITGARAGDSNHLEMRYHKMLEDLSRPGVVRLPAGHVYCIEIHVDAGLTEKKLELVEEGQPRRQDVYFPDADTPGTYELRATFRRDSQRRGSVVKKGYWSGVALTSPPVTIELRK